MNVCVLLESFLPALSPNPCMPDLSDSEPIPAIKNLGIYHTHTITLLTPLLTYIKKLNIDVQKHQSWFTHPQTVPLLCVETVHNLDFDLDLSAQRDSFT